jgi:thiamine biosynthesis lipoprotein
MTHVVIVDTGDAERSPAPEPVFAAMERLIGIFDHRRMESPLAELNHEGKLNRAPIELLQLIRTGIKYGHLSEGAFDISVKPAVDRNRRQPELSSEGGHSADYRDIEVTDREIFLRKKGMQLTLDGIAKGRVVDAAVDRMRDMGIQHILVEAGGDLSAPGSKANGLPWRIGIQHPRTAEKTIAVMDLKGGAVCTSGDYQNAFTRDYGEHHIVDPRTGRSPAEVCSATVLAPTAMDADAISTGLMVMGVQQGLQLIERMPGVEAMLIGKDLRSQCSSGFPLS